jgi:hypothetical protein
MTDRPTNPEAIIKWLRYERVDGRPESQARHDAADMIERLVKERDALVAEVEACLAEIEYLTSGLAHERDASRILAEKLDKARADAKAGWDSFYKMRRLYAEQRYPDLTGEVKALDAARAALEAK